MALESAANNGNGNADGADGTDTPPAEGNGNGNAKNARKHIIQVRIHFSNRPAVMARQ